jgi:hypothetical protein
MLHNSSVTVLQDARERMDQVLTVYECATIVRSRLPDVLGSFVHSAQDLEDLLELLRDTALQLVFFKGSADKFYSLLIPWRATVTIPCGFHTKTQCYYYVNHDWETTASVNICDLTGTKLLLGRPKVLTSKSSLRVSPARVLFKSRLPQFHRIGS